MVKDQSVKSVNGWTDGAECITSKAVINCCYVKDRVVLTQNYSVFKITTINNSFCPSYASYLAKSALLSRRVNGKQGMTRAYQHEPDSVPTVGDKTLCVKCIPGRTLWCVYLDV